MLMHSHVQLEAFDTEYQEICGFSWFWTDPVDRGPWGRTCPGFNGFDAFIHICEVLLGHQSIPVVVAVVVARKVWSPETFMSRLFVWMHFNTFYFVFIFVLLLFNTFSYFWLLFTTFSLNNSKNHLDVPFPGVPGSPGGVPGSPRVSSQKVQRGLERVREC